MSFLINKLMRRSPDTEFISFVSEHAKGIQGNETPTKSSLMNTRKSSMKENTKRF